MLAPRLGYDDEKMAHRKAAGRKRRLGAYSVEKLPALVRRKNDGALESR
jgi:hypothetical protein